MTEIFQVTSDEYVPVVRELFREYEKDIGFDLCFQGFADELANLPGEYAPPYGEILLAERGGEIAGCVVMQRISDSFCEMKRLYVRPAFRGSGLGRKLAEAIIDAARGRNYTRMRLDTVPGMEKAISLYRKLGFQDIDSYRHNPIPGTLYMELEL
ncbi:MAG: GNAT family N-acetyltransferase [Planctomycetota bacterium]|jgi:ribosomal protein S18 acetylase RimI-like enzyme